MKKLSLDEAIALPDEPDLDLIALDDALNTLTAIDPRQGKIVELRFFGGLSVEETTELLTIQRRLLPTGNWMMAEAESLLGECLRMQKRYAEAEPLLIESYQDLKASRGDKHHLTWMRLSAW